MPLMGTASTKPMEGSGRLERHARRQERLAGAAKLKQREKLEAAKLQRQYRITTYNRDGGMCRATGEPVYLEHPDPFKVAHCHHIVYRSAQGSDLPHNRVTLSPKAHQLEHDGRLDITGDPNKTLFFTQRDTKGRVVRTWESPCPFPIPEDK